MPSRFRTGDLEEPDPSLLEWRTLTRVLDAPIERDLLECLLDDPVEEQGRVEHASDNFESPVTGSIERGLDRLREAGWVHQRRGPQGVVTRLRRDDLDRQFPGLLDHLTLRMRVDFTS